MSIFVKHILNDRKYDSRGILTVGHQRTQIFAWAKENTITLSLAGTLYGKDLWYVKDDEHRVWFALRWS